MTRVNATQVGVTRSIRGRFFRFESGGLSDLGLYGGTRRFFGIPPLQSILQRLVAETGADSDLVTALGTAAIEDGGTCLGLHAGEKAVGLGAVAAVGLEGTLRHGKKLLRQDRFLLKLLGCCNNL
jgi:hypothetical protein